MKRMVVLAILSLGISACAGSKNQTAGTTDAERQAASEQNSGGAGPFYVWPKAIPESPGQLLRQEPLEEALVLENAGSAVRFLYSSRGWNDQPVAVSGDAFTPKGDAPEAGWPILAWSHGTLGVADICAPSFAGHSERDKKFLNKWLAEGYAIVATDYEGLGTPGGHAYLHCRSEANSNIDAVSAARQLGLALSDRWLVIGQSQGGQGALCTGAYVAERAQALDFRGTLATAPAVNWKQRFSVGTPDEPSPFVGMSLLLARGFEVYEPSFDPNEAFTAATLEMMPYTDTACVGELIGMGMKANLTMGESLKIVPFGDIPGAGNGAEKMDVPVEGWSTPVYMAQGTADTLVRYVDVQNFSAQLCARGVNVTLDVYEGLEHSGPMNTGFEEFKNWVALRFTDTPAEGNCGLIESLAQ
ncbi:MAG: alpha/beta hydrolase family protein [Pseudomonadales bacterium]